MKFLFLYGMKNVTTMNFILTVMKYDEKKFQKYSLLPSTIISVTKSFGTFSVTNGCEKRSNVMVYIFYRKRLFK